jgi:hypothetical protein
MNEPSDDEIQNLAARNRELAARLENLQLKRAAEERTNAYYFHLIEDNERMEREIARLEGRPYRDSDDDGADYRDPPEPPDPGDA